MKWPLGKKFDLWVDAASSDILEPIQNVEIGSFKRWDYIIPPEAEVSGNFIALPGFTLRARFARKVWGTFTSYGEGLRVRGRYGCSLAGLSIIFALFLLFFVAMTIQLLADGSTKLDDIWAVGTIVIGTLIYDRITRPFAKNRYDDFVGYLVRVSRDGAVHPMEGRDLGDGS